MADIMYLQGEQDNDDDLRDFLDDDDVPDHLKFDDDDVRHCESFVHLCECCQSKETVTRMMIQAETMKNHCLKLRMSAISWMLSWG